MTVKSYVLDTNVLIYDPESIFQFEDNKIYLPIFVLEEIDKIKVEHSSRGVAARQVARHLDELRIKGKLSQGVALDNGGSLTIYVPKVRKKLDIAINDSIDCAILQTVIDIQEKDPEFTIFVTLDINLRVRAESLDIQTATYENNRVHVSELKNEPISIELSKDDIDSFYHDKSFTIDGEFHENASLVLKCGTQSALARYSGGYVKKLNNQEKTFGIKPKNKEQAFALDLLLDEKVELVTLMGLAGSGKSLLAIAAGLQQVLEGKYQKLLVARPIVPMGKDLGFLPGDLSEKMGPWMQPIFDNVDFLMMNNKAGRGLDLEEILQIQALTYIRGRTLPNQYIIIDETQNLSDHEIKTIITRCGEGSKIVMTGDPYQIDNAYLDEATNGLSVLVKKMNNLKSVGHIKLSKGERSSLATLAADIL